MAPTVLVTGCSSGFGLATAQRFVRAGWNVIATMRSPTPIDGAFVTRLDVEDRASIATAVEAGLARFGAIDVLVNNAGYGLFGVFEQTPRDQIVAQFATNVFGLMDVTRAVLPAMRARRRGVILNITSGAGVFGLPLSSAYSASKFAVEGWSEALAYELATLGIVVKLIEPGGVDTNFGARSAGEANSTTPIADYLPFLNDAGAVYAKLRDAHAGSSTADVAEVVFGAATDGSAQLRYVATPQIAEMVETRRRAGEAEYERISRAAMGYRLDTKNGRG
ncbi:MAG: SDR family oxidoreductase [Kofleriaceae bacterium]